MTRFPVSIPESYSICGSLWLVKLQSFFKLLSLKNTHGMALRLRIMSNLWCKDLGRRTGRRSSTTKQPSMWYQERCGKNYIALVHFIKGQGPDRRWHFMVKNWERNNCCPIPGTPILAGHRLRRCRRRRRRHRSRCRCLSRATRTGSTSTPSTNTSGTSTNASKTQTEG